MQILLVLILSNFHRIVKCTNISYTQMTCNDPSTESYSITTATKQCSINFTFNGSANDNLFIQDANIHDFAVPQLVSLTIKNSTFQMCQFQLDYIGAVFLDNVIFKQTQNECNNSFVKIIAHDNITLQSIVVQDYNVHQYDFLIKLQCQFISMINVLIRNNSCYLTNILVLTVQQSVSINFITFENNSIVLGSAVQVGQGLSMFTGNDLLFKNNHVSSGQFIVIQPGGINQSLIYLRNLCIQDNIIDHLSINQQRLSIVDQGDDYETTYFDIQENNLIQFSYGQSQKLYNTSMLNNTLKFQFSVVLLASNQSSTQLYGVNVRNNHFGSLQTTLFKFYRQFDIQIQDVIFDESNIRSPDDIVNGALQQLRIMNSTIKMVDQDSHTYYQDILFQFRSQLQIGYYEQFPILGVFAWEVVNLTIISLNVSLYDTTVFQVIQTLNQIQFLTVQLSDVNISRQSYGQNTFDIGAIVISGVFIQFNLQLMVLNKLRIGKRSMIQIDSLSGYSLLAPCTIIIQDVVIQKSDFFNLDTNLISLITIAQNVEHNITIKSVGITAVNFFSYPSYYSSIMTQIKNLEVKQDFKLHLDVTHLNQAYESYQQVGIFINIRSKLSSVVLSGWNISDISYPNDKNCIHLIAHSIWLQDFICTELTTYINSQLMTLHGSHINLSNINILNSSSLQGQIVVIQAVGQDCLISMTHMQLSNLFIYKDVQYDNYDSLPLIQIREKAQTKLFIDISRLQMTSITKQSIGELLSIESKKTKFALLQLSDTKLKKILMSEDDSAIGVKFQFVGVVKIKNLTFEDEDLVNIDRSFRQFTLMSFYGMNQLRLQGILIQSQNIYQALNASLVANIYVKQFDVIKSQLIPQRGQLIVDYIHIQLFDYAEFRQVTFDSLISLKTQIFGFYSNRAFYVVLYPINKHDTSQVVLEGIVLKNNTDQNCCSNFFYFGQVFLYINNIQAHQNTNYTLFQLNQTRLSLKKSSFGKNQVTQNYQCPIVDGMQLYNGSIINAIQSFVKILSSSFFQNKGSYLGGVIFFIVNFGDLLAQSPYSLKSKKVIYSNCSAQYGGAVYHKSLDPSSNFNESIFQYNGDFKDQFDDVASIPNSIHLTLIELQDGQKSYISRFNGSVTHSNKLQINNIRSGAKLVLSLQLQESNATHYDFVEVDFEGWGETLTFLNGSYIFDQKLVDNSIQSLQLNVIDTLKQNDSLVSNLSINFDLLYRDCLPGEQLTKDLNTATYICSDCPQYTYSSFNNSLFCHVCPPLADCSGGTLFQIATGQWRFSSTSNESMQCEYKNCKENQQNGTQCLIGYLGPICEQCDTLGLIWMNNFQRSSNHGCNECTQNSISLWKYILVVIFIVLTIQYQLTTTYNGNVSLSLVRYIRILGILPMGTSGLFNNNVYIKILIFHFQILTILQGSWKNNALSGLIENQNLVGNQSQILMFFTDCVYGKYNISIPSLAYLDVMTAIFYCIIFIMIGFLISLTNIYLKRFKRNYRRFIVIFSFWTQIPQIAFYIIGALSCRDILGSYFVKSDMTQTCFGKDHIFYISVLLVPTLVLQIISGLLGLFYLKYNRNLLSSVRINCQYGMLFQEFKSQFCYFEIVKLLVKLTLVFSINILVDNLVIMTAMISLVLLSYYYLINSLRPYIFYRTQKIDQTEILLLIFTIQLMTMLQFTSTPSLQTLLIVLTICINVTLGLNIFFYLFQYYVRSLNQRKIYDYTAKFIPFIVKIFTKRPKIKDNSVFNNWRSLRQSIYPQIPQVSSKNYNPIETLMNFEDIQLKIAPKVYLSRTI